MECLNNIVGITRTVCPCVTNGLTEQEKIDIAASNSGLYIDELEGAIAARDIKTLDSCGEYFRLAKDALKVAAKRFADDIELALSKQYDTAKPNYNGELGRITYAGFLAKNKPYQYMKIEPKSIGDAVITLINARVIVNAVDTLNVFILAGFEGETPQVIHATQVETMPNMYAGISLPVNKQLPTTVNGRKMIYYFAWQGAQTTQARDNKLSCGCTGGNAYEDFVYLKGGESDNLNLQGGADDGFSHGFTVNVKIQCETGALVCREYSAKNKIAVASAYAILYKANELLNEFVLSSGEINRFTLMKRDALWGKRNHFRAKYEEHLNWLSYEIDVKKSGCFICRENKIFVNNIFG